MRLVCLLLAAVMLAPAQIEDTPKAPVVLPNGKLQRDEIRKMEHRKSVDDSAQLARLAQEVKDDIEQSGDYSVSVKTIKKLDDIEKLTKSIRARIKRS